MVEDGDKFGLDARWPMRMPPRAVRHMRARRVSTRSHSEIRRLLDMIMNKVTKVNNRVKLTLHMVAKAMG